MRVDIMDPTASLTSEAPSDIYMNLFITNPGDPLSITYTNLSADLSAYAGQTVRIRIAECNNQGYFQGAVDAVSVISAAAPASIPTMNEWGIIIFSLILAGSAIWMIRRRQVS